ncbi:MAG: zinc-dependent metalloprotease [Saprospiraceae bacterium]|nr:zinc-dependent metalloprotease [Saprospiraceae bacterium]
MKTIFFIHLLCPLFTRIWFIRTTRIALLLWNVSLFSSSISAQIFQPAITGPYFNGTAPLFIRVYFVYVESPGDAWASALGHETLTERTAQSFNLLNRVFNPYNIYFTPRPGLEQGCYEVAYNFVYQSDPYALTIAVGPDDAAPVTSIPGEILPTIHCFVGGSEGGVPASNLPYLIQIVGHCFGLARTDAYTTANLQYTGPTATCDWGDCISASTNNPDHCCGDLIDDTPALFLPSGVVQAMDDCCCSTVPIGVGMDMLSNYMTPTTPARCRTKFSPEQVQRMTEYLFFFNSPLSSIKITPTTLNTSANWDTARTIYTPIEIPQGVTLTINAPIEFMPGTSLIVRRGGTLIINSTLTAACRGLWGGVFVEGNSAFPQIDENGNYSDKQGRIRLAQQGLIEHAVCGICVEDLIAGIDADLGGGIAEVFGRVSNCLTGIRIERYIKAHNRSLLTGARLSIDDNYRGQAWSPKPVLVDLKKIKQIRINYTLFSDSRTNAIANPSLRAEGLSVDDATFWATGCHFYGLENGIYSSNFTSETDYGFSRVLRCQFNNCVKGIYSIFSPSFTARGNKFKLDKIDYGSGVYIGSFLPPMALDLENNYFEAERNGNEDSLYVWGVSCSSLGSAENVIQKNRFKGMSYAFVVSGVNGNDTGLRFLCNQCENSLLGDYVVDWTIRKIQAAYDEQGNPVATGNLFSEGHPAGWSSWYNYGDPITYYYAALPRHNPESAVGVDAVLSTTLNPDCSTQGVNCPQPCDSISLVALSNEFYRQQSAWLDKRSRLALCSNPDLRSDLAAQIAWHRSAMDWAGGRLMQYYIRGEGPGWPDSARVWEDRLMRYESEVRLARLEFLNGHWAEYDWRVSTLHQRVTLDSLQSEEWASFTALLQVLRPALESGAAISALPSEVLDEVEEWAITCDEPGRIAREVLRRNRRPVSNKCEILQIPHPLSQTAQPIAKSMTRANVYPNPAREHFLIRQSGQGGGSSTLTLLTLQGIPVLQQKIAMDEPIRVNGVPAGIYFWVLHTPGSPNQQGKIVLLP